MAVNDEYFSDYTGSDGWRWKVSVRTSAVNNPVGGFTPVALHASVIQGHSLEGGYEKFPVGVPSKIPNAKIQVLLSAADPYLQERIIDPVRERTILPFQEQGDETEYTIEAQNVWIFQTDRGGGGSLETVFIGIQTPVPEDIYDRTKEGYQIVEISMIAVDIAAHRLMTTSNMLAYKCYYLAYTGYGNPKIVTTVYNTAYAHTGAGQRFFHISRLSHSGKTYRFILFTKELLFRALEDLYLLIMRHLMRDAEWSAYYTGRAHAHLSLWRTNLQQNDDVSTLLNDSAAYFIAGVTLNQPDELRPPSDWIAGMLSNDRDSFQGEGYTNGWEIVEALSKNFFSKVQMRPNKVEFTTVFGSTNPASPTPVFVESSKKVRRGGNVLVGCEIVYQGRTNDDLPGVTIKSDTSSQNQEVPVIPIVLNTAPSIPAFNDVEFTLGTGFYANSLFATSYDVNMRALYYAVPAGTLVDTEIMLRASSFVDIDTGIETVSTPREAYELPFLPTTTDAAFLQWWTDLRECYAKQQRTAGLGVAVAQAMYVTFKDYLQAVTTGEVYKEYALPCDLGDKATVDASTVSPVLSVINENTILLNTAASGKTAKIEYLHRGH